MDAIYNDIQEWKNKELVDVFGAHPEKSKTFQVRTKQEAENLFNDKSFSSAPFLQVSGLSYLIFKQLGYLIKNQFVEIHMPKEDAPKALRLTSEAAATLNAKQ